MRETKAARLRFAILSARAHCEPCRLTPNQQAFLHDVDSNELMIGDRGTLRAYEREYEASKGRALDECSICATPSDRCCGEYPWCCNRSSEHKHFTPKETL